MQAHRCLGCNSGHPTRVQSPLHANQACKPALPMNIAAGKSLKRSIIAMAGPKGGKGGKTSKLAGLLQKKKEVETRAELAVAEQRYRDPEIRSLLLMIVNSYWKHTKKYLIETDFDTLPDALFNAPFCLLAHNKYQEGVTVPTYTYANRAGLEMFEATWDEFIGIPSTKTTPDAQQDQQVRDTLLDQAGSKGIVTCEGWRVGLKGRRVYIKGVQLFNIEDADGEKIGQAVVLDRYDLENGKEVVVQGYQEATAAASAAAAESAVPSAEQLEEAQQAVQKWGEYVRTLKEVQGLTNKDPQVQEAVGSLQAWKAQLANLQKRLDDALAAAKAAFDDED